MAKYRFLQDCVDANGLYYRAGTVASTADVGGSLPSNFIPAAVDPLDAAAIQAFWNAGPQQLGLCRPQWNGIGVAPPSIYWISYPQGGGTKPMILTGAGATLGFRNWLDTRGANP